METSQMSETSASAKAKDNEISVEKKNAAAAKKQKQMTDPSFNMDELRDLANLVIEHGFTNFWLRNDTIRWNPARRMAVPLPQVLPPLVPLPPAPPMATRPFP